MLLDQLQHWHRFCWVWHSVVGFSYMPKTCWVTFFRSVVHARCVISRLYNYDTSSCRMHLQFLDARPQHQSWEASLFWNAYDWPAQHRVHPRHRAFLGFLVLRWTALPRTRHRRPYYNSSSYETVSCTNKEWYVCGVYILHVSIESIAEKVKIQSRWGAVGIGIPEYC